MSDMAQEQEMTKDFVDVSCDVCGLDSTEQKYQLKNSFIVKCNNCGFHYVSPRVSSIVIQKAIQEWAEKDVVDEERIRIAFEPNTLELYRRYLKWINKYASTGGRKLLDIGCSTGALLSVARTEGWDSRGVELGKASSSYASSQMGLNVFRGSLYDFLAEPKSIDVVTFTEVIEHLESPKLALQKIHTWLKSGGLLFITTPNYNSFYRRRFGSRWWVINCEEEHIMFFSPESLKKLLEQCGYDVLFEHIRGIDLVGMLNQSRDVKTDQAGYYSARTGKENIKGLLNKIGLLKMIRYGLRCVDYLCSKKWSPFYSWGEQLIIIARKK